MPTFLFGPTIMVRFIHGLAMLGTTLRTMSACSNSTIYSSTAIAIWSYCGMMAGAYTRVSFGVLPIAVYVSVSSIFSSDADFIG